jgi:glycogen operon protein
LRKRLPLLRQRRYLHGEKIAADETKDVLWLRPDGVEMTPEDWNNGLSKSIGLMLCGAEDPPLLILTNSHSEDLRFKLAAPKSITSWRLLADTARGLIEPDQLHVKPGATVTLPARALLLYEAVR